MLSIVDIANIVLSTLSALATLFIGFAALKVSKNANRLSFMDKAFEIYNYFTVEIHQESYFIQDEPIREKNFRRINEIEYLSKFIFKINTYSLILEEIQVVRKLIDGIYRGPCSHGGAILNDEYAQSESQKLELVLLAIRWNVEDIFKKYRLNL